MHMCRYLFQFNSAAQLHLILCKPMNGSTPGFLVHHQLLELAQTHVHWVVDTVQLSVAPSSFCLQSFSASKSFPLSQFFTSGGQNIGVSASASSPSNECSGLISFRMDWLDLLTVQSLVHSIAQKHQFSSIQLLYGPAHSYKCYWKNHSLDQMDLSHSTCLLWTRLCPRY